MARKPSGVIVAADCDEIAAAVHSFGGRAELTNPYCACGTDRVAEIASRFSDFQIFVNVQGDEPELSGAGIDLAVELLERDERTVMSTLAAPIREKERLFDPGCVKVVFSGRGQAIYFSRAPIRSRGSGAIRCWRPSPRPTINTSESTPIAVNFCSTLQRCLVPRSNASKAWSSCASWTLGTALQSASWTRPRAA
ncbi:MAG: hypothetical protein L0228_15195 [Planctomycetes bacterium]|nr:hypothetical protein [Planctomycetota bacterium]